jgi:hypothetical protein
MYVVQQGSFSAGDKTFFYSLLGNQFVFVFHVSNWWYTPF